MKPKEFKSLSKLCGWWFQRSLKKLYISIHDNCPLPLFCFEIYESFIPMDWNFYVVFLTILETISADRVKHVCVGCVNLIYTLYEVSWPT